MTRTASPTRPIKQLKTKSVQAKTKQTAKKPTKTPTKIIKEGWEMSARDALKVDFVISEI